ncbi:aldo/keto reductase [Frigoriglobus tundricola]|uniref:Oxidoreductase, aldo/keto reductase family n=1 Tax=Frigoriglobus tundricola TaxID=2774151 RepID=A0A6M5YWN5_9BACT|nr:aldo/keto reductase [Frigoriglobus tundricola]QJW98348.1 Oxidoreductase, aldo/keto reductase family [Frigoriglobus tundricola]
MSHDRRPDGPVPPPRGGEPLIPLRPFGTTKATVSALGLGGHHLGDVPSVEEAIRIVHAAIDGGITFFDNCWEYYNGRTENWLGRALTGKRDRVFLMTKVCTHGRGKDLARKMLDESLRRLGTDHLDLWQVHAVSYDNDPDLAYARGGVIEALEEAKKAGKTRFVGFTGHKDPAIHLKMLRLGYPFDSVQMPLNPFDAGFAPLSFEHRVLPELLKRGIAPLGMKAMGGTAAAIKRGVLTGEEALRYAMSLPVAVTICGMETMDVLKKNLKIAQGFQSLAAEAMDAIRKKCAALAADGRYEPYKVSLKYDNPETRQPHGFPVEPENKEMKEMFKEAGAKPK